MAPNDLTTPPTRRLPRPVSVGLALSIAVLAGSAGANINTTTDAAGAPKMTVHAIHPARHLPDGTSWAGTV